MKESSPKFNILHSGELIPKLLKYCIVGKLLVLSYRVGNMLVLSYMVGISFLKPSLWGTIKNLKNICSFSYIMGNC